jgi:hypothetical protein
MADNAGSRSPRGSGKHKQESHASGGSSVSCNQGSSIRGGLTPRDFSAPRDGTRPHQESTRSREIRNIVDGMMASDRKEEGGTAVWNLEKSEDCHEIRKFIVNNWHTIPFGEANEVLFQKIRSIYYHSMTDDKELRSLLSLAATWRNWFCSEKRDKLESYLVQIQDTIDDCDQDGSRQSSHRSQDREDPEKSQTDPAEACARSSSLAMDDDLLDMAKSGKVDAGLLMFMHNRKYDDE